MLKGPHGNLSLYIAARKSLFDVSAAFVTQYFTVDFVMELLQSAQFANHVQKLINHHSVTGIAISLVQDQKIVSLAVGKASLESSAAFTPDSLIPVGSLSKSLTAAAVALLVHDNERYPDVQYETPIASFLPDDFVMPGDDHNDITLEDVLSHRTGMPP